MKAKLRMLFMTFVIAAVLSAAVGSTVHARNMAGAGTDANACVGVVSEMLRTSKDLPVGTLSDYSYWHFTISNVCPHPIVFHYCFFRLKNSTCGTRSAYYESVQTIYGFQKYEIADRNPIQWRAPEKNTVRLEWLACPENGSRMPKAGLWRDARSCRN